MGILTSPLQYVSKARARRRQVRMALHMLSVSGVIRPSHIEPRYFEASSQLDSWHRQEAKGPSKPSIPVPSVAGWGTALDWSKFRQLISTSRSSRLIEQ
jgi:hypothetical protein